MVPNIIIKDSRVVFIAESPYINEMKSGYPLAGDSGQEITKALIDSTCPALGSICNDRTFKRYGFNEFSIINVSPFPLEKGAYMEGYPHNLDTLIALKQNIDRQHKSGSNFHEHWTVPKSEQVKKLKERLLTELIKNLHSLTNESKVHLIPCGKFARVFVRKALEEESLATQFTMLKGIPHPSRNQWSSLSVSKLKDIQDIVLSSTT